MGWEIVMGLICGVVEIGFGVGFGVGVGVGVMGLGVFFIICGWGCEMGCIGLVWFISGLELGIFIGVVSVFEVGCFCKLLVVVILFCVVLVVFLLFMLVSRGYCFFMLLKLIVM